MENKSSPENLKPVYKLQTPTLWGTNVMLSRKLLQVAHRVKLSVMIAAEKVGAHMMDPELFPLPDDKKSLEQLIFDQLNTLSGPKKESAVAKFTQYTYEDNKCREAIYGGMHKIDLHSRTSVAEQLKKIPILKEDKFEFSENNYISTLQDNIKYFETPLFNDKGVIEQLTDVTTPTKPIDTSKLSFQINKIHCIDETNDPGDDEIKLRGIQIDALGNSSKIPFIPKEKYRTGKEKNFDPPKCFTTFDLTTLDNDNNPFWPKTFSVILILAEKDTGGLESFLNDVVVYIRQLIITELISAGIAVASETTAAILAGEILTGVLGGLMAGIIIAVCAIVVTLLFGWIKSLLEDDVFPPFSQGITVNSLNDRWDGNQESGIGKADFIDHGGYYQVEYSWKFHN